VGRGRDEFEVKARWMLGGLLAIVAVLGVGIFIMLLALVLQPPVWVQALTGSTLAVGAAALSWFMASPPHSGRRS
jgi:hypothetical protein